jgi:hypothetical protein
MVLVTHCTSTTAEQAKKIGSELILNDKGFKRSYDKMKTMLGFQKNML